MAEKTLKNHMEEIIGREHEINKLLGDDYKLLNLIGEGTFGTIFSVQSPKDKRLYACKVESTHQKVSYVCLQKIILVEKEWNMLL